MNTPQDDLMHTATWFARRVTHEALLLDQSARNWETHVDAGTPVYHTLSRPLDPVIMHNRAAILLMQQLGELFQKEQGGALAGHIVRSAMQDIPLAEICFTAVEEYGKHLLETHPGIEAEYDKILLERAQGRDDRAGESLRALLKTCPEADATDTIMRHLARLLTHVRLSCLSVIETSLLLFPPTGEGHA